MDVLSISSKINKKKSVGALTSYFLIQKLNAMVGHSRSTFFVPKNQPNKQINDCSISKCFGGLSLYDLYIHDSMRFEKYINLTLGNELFTLVIWLSPFGITNIATCGLNKWS